MHNLNMTRTLDFFLAVVGLALTSPILLIISAIGLFDTGSPIFRQERLGREKAPFTLIKFRTMRVNTESVASHLVAPAAITPFGKFLRKSKFDELPQLWNVLRGDMSLVGPRPNLSTQQDVIQARDALGVYAVRPGITGLAQIQNIDMSTPELLAETDAEMIAKMSLSQYFGYILQTVLGSGSGDAVKG